MRISELIRELENLKENVGEVEIVVHDPAFIFTKDLEIVEQEPGTWSIEYKETEHH